MIRYSYSIYTVWCAVLYCVLSLYNTVSIFPLFSGFTFVVFFHHKLYCLSMMFFIYMVYFFSWCSLFSPGVLVYPHGLLVHTTSFSHDVLCRQSCSMSFHDVLWFLGFFLHTCCVVLKHFPCLYMGFCLHVFRGRGGNICSNETLCCTALLYGILMSSLTVSVLSNWVSIVTCTPAFVVVHLHWLLHVYRIELN